ncbi:MAG: acyl-ACP--UDP-N-acetylglucosamine O-acyltransferase [Candidatus Xenobia bacterium]
MTLTPEITVHPSAIVHPHARLGNGVEIGPYAVVGEHVTIGEGTRIGPHCVLEGWTTIGRNCQIYPGACLGMAPQDLRYKGERSFTHIGDNNVIREYVTIHRAYEKDGVTRVGSGNLIMAYVHVAHNCVLGNDITIANLVTMAGHVEIEDQAVIGGMAGIHQFVRIGRLAMVGGLSRVTKDIPPFAIIAGQPARIYGLNTRGMKRRQVSLEARHELKASYRLLTQSGLPLPSAVQAIAEQGMHSEEVAHLLAFLAVRSRMGVLFKTSRVRAAAALEVVEDGGDL